MTLVLSSDVTSAVSGINTVSGALSGIDGAANISVTADVADAVSNIQEVDKEMESATGGVKKDTTVSVTADVAEAVSNIQEVDKEMESATGGTKKDTTVSVTADVAEAVSNIQTVDDQLQETSAEGEKEISVTADVAEATGALQEVDAELAAAGGENEISVTADVAEATGALQEVDAELAAAETDKTVKVAADVAGAVETIQDFSMRALPDDMSISVTANTQEAVAGMEVVAEKLKATPDGKRIDLSASGAKAITGISAVDGKLHALPANKNISVTANVNAALAQIGLVSKKLEVNAAMMTGAFGGMGGLAGIATVGGAVAILGNVAKKGDEIADGAKRIGVTTAEYQQLAYAAEQTGASAGSVEVAFKRMNMVLDGADEESKTAQVSLGRLGLTLADFGGKSQEQKFALIVSKLGSITDATERAAIAMQVFGRGAQELGPMLNEYEALKQELQDIGGIMSAEAVDAADRLGDSINSLTKQFTALVADSGVLDFLAKAAEGMNALSANSKRMEGINAGGAYKEQGFWGNLKDAYFGESEGEKITTGATSKAAVDAKLEQKNAPKAPTKLESISNRGAAIEEDLMALTGRQQASALDSEKLMLQGEINKKMVEYKDLLKEAAAAGIKEADIQLKKINDQEKAKKTMEGIVGDMQQQIMIQDMLAAGKQREAYIEGELYRLQKTHPNRANTPEEEKEITGLADTIFTGNADKAQNDMMAEMQEQVRLQELINAGKARQAFIEETLAKFAKQRGEVLSEEAINSITELAGKSFDLNNKGASAPEMKTEVPNVDSFAKLGLYNFGEGVSKSLDVERNSLLKQIAAKVGLPVMQEVLA